MMTLPKKMYAGIVEGKIYVVPLPGDQYAPLGIALFHSRTEANRHFETVVEIDPEKFLAGVKNLDN